MLKNLFSCRSFILLSMFLLIIALTLLFNIKELKFNINPSNALFAIIFISFLIILTYIWSQELLGGWWALLPPFLLIFSPDILSSNHLSSISYLFISHPLVVFCYTAAAYWLMEFFFKPSRLNLIAAGLNFGLAQLTGFPALILIPYFLILISIFYIANVKKDWLTTEPLARFKRFGVRGFRYFDSIIVIFVIGFLFVFLFHWAISLINEMFFQFEPAVSGFSAIPDKNFDFPSTRNIFERIINSLLNKTPTVSHQSITSIFKPYWLFIILIAASFIDSLINIIKSFRASGFKGFFDYLGTSFPEFSMIVFIVMYSLFILFFTSGISAEKLIPILPMIYILTASGLKRLLMNKL